MDKREILQRIIDDEGYCEALHARTQFYLCKECPMSKLKQRPDGSYYSCWDAIVYEGDSIVPYTGTAVAKAYKEKAIELLQDIIMEDILKGDDSATEDS